MDHMAISTAPVSEPGTMPIRKSSGTSSTWRVRSIASCRRALPSFDLCDRPRTAFWRFWGFQPGRLAHGPEENSGRAGRIAGVARVVIAMSPILTDEQRPVGGAWPAAEKPWFPPGIKRKFSKPDVSGTDDATAWCEERPMISRSDDEPPATNRLAGDGLPGDRLGLGLRRPEDRSGVHLAGLERGPATMDRGGDPGRGARHPAPEAAAAARPGL